MPLSTFLNGRPPTRGLVWLSLSDVGVFLTRTFTSDSGGGGTASWASSGTVDCRIDAIPGMRGGLTGGAIDERSTHIVTVPTGSTINVQNRFAITGRGTYEVTAVRERTDPLAQTFEVLHLQ